jgi:hypothetical protein
MMYQSPNEQVHTAELVVAFIDGTAHARIPTGANVADICERVRRFSRQRHKAPLSVKVQFDVLNPDSHTAASVMLRTVLSVPVARRTPKVEIIDSAHGQSGLSALRRLAEIVASHDQRHFNAIMN